MTKSIINQEYNKFLRYLKERVSSSRYKAALSVNRELILLYHHIGTQILEAQERQGWGAKVIDQLSKDLVSEFPEMKGFSTRNLKYMRKFAKEYLNSQFVQEVLAQLTWYHNVLEKWLKRQNIKVVKMHSRLSAEPFYRKLGFAEMSFDDPSIQEQSIDLGKVL